MKSKKSLRVAIVGAASLGLASVVALAGPAIGATIAGPTIETAQDQLSYQYATNKATSPDGSIVAFAGYSSNVVTLAYQSSHTQVSVSDPNSDFNGPYASVFSPDGTKLYVANYSSNELAVVDVATATVSSAATLSADEMEAIGVSTDGRYIIVTDDYDDIRVYDTTNNYIEVGSGIDLDASAFVITDLSATTARVIDGDGKIYVVDLTTGTLTSSVVIQDLVDADGFIYAACASPDNSVRVAVDYNNNVLLKFDIVTGNTIATLDLTPDSDSLASCAINSDGKMVVSDWGVDVGDGRVYIVDTSNMTLLETIALPDMGMTNVIGLMANDDVFVGGYETDIATFTLSANKTPELANTGVAFGGFIGMTVVASGAIAIGLFVVTRRRRHA